MDNLLFIDEAQGLSPFMERPILSQSDHLVNILPHGTGTCPSGLDTTVFKELSCEASKKCPTLVWWPIELGNSPAMPHGKKARAIINRREGMSESRVVGETKRRGGEGVKSSERARKEWSSLLLLLAASAREADALPGALATR